MYSETIDQFAKLAQKKVNVLDKAPVAFIISAMMAGAYFQKFFSVLSQLLTGHPTDLTSIAPDK